MATHLEQRLVAGLAARAGWDPEVAGGVVTSGGTQSNLMGLLLARDAIAGRSGRDVAADGLGPDAGRYRVACSELAHFSVARSAALLGLGSRAVQPTGCRPPWPGPSGPPVPLDHVTLATVAGQPCATCPLLPPSETRRRLLAPA